MEITVNYERFKYLQQEFSKNLANEVTKQDSTSIARLQPLVLAYVGDSYFSLYVRTRLVRQGKYNVNILNNFGSKIVSATLQAKAMREIEAELNEIELEIMRRGRNAKSSVPKSASVADYRLSTAFEAIVGYLYLSEQNDRLEEIVQKAFITIAQEMTK